MLGKFETGGRRHVKRDEIRQLARIGLQLGMLMIWKIISHYDERHDSRGYFYRFVRNFFGAGRATRPRLEPTGSVEAVKRSVRANPQGIGVLSRYSVAEELEAGSVRQLRIQPGVPPLCLQVLLHRTRDPIHPATADLLEALRTVLDEHGVSPRSGSTPRRSTRFEKSSKSATNARVCAQSPSHR